MGKAAARVAVKVARAAAVRAQAVVKAARAAVQRLSPLLLA
jgi:hypothetical protein